ncbi:hypothetical protein FACS189468_8320 [Spirochaetia bacterium]|nr:hypothetical protein FACS189468_8320 [Spirochaetia bacterium]
MGSGIDITGASGAIPVSDGKRRNAHARRFYEEVRKRTTDIAAIAGNTGWEAVKIEKVKSHIFFARHDLGYDEPVRFDPDYNMAVSWQRLTDGTDIQEEDYLLLEHEYLELSLMESKGLNYTEAHTKATERFDYAAAIRCKEEAQ